MSSLKTLSARGDTTIATWDETKTDTPEAKAAIAEATRYMAEARQKGQAVMQVIPGEPATLYKGTAVPETQVDLVTFPRLAGG